MCGIFGYIGPEEAIQKVLEGIRKLEYRGYDSAGVASISHGKLEFQKSVGKVDDLQKAVPTKWKSHVAISHTRWATHGKPSQLNAHPHFDTQIKCAIVHNGIIENHEAVRRLLEKRGIKFISETDTEVISHLIGYLYKGNFLKAVQRALPLLRGAFAIAAIHQDHDDEIICAAKESPLAIGRAEGAMYLASDAQAFLKYTRNVIYLKASELALIKRNEVKVFNGRFLPVEREYEELSHDIQEATKGNFQHYMLKEIYEQPQAIQNALLSRYSEEFGTAIFDGLHISDEELQKIQRVIILACGTSYHAGLLAGLMIEERARIPVEVEISSEYRYRNPIVRENTLVIAISQSGETADTIAALRELKEKGAKIIGVSNVQGSTLTREVENSLFLRAGPEIGVAATKTFTSQLVVLSLLTLKLARMRMMSQQEGKAFIQALKKLPEQLKIILDRASDLEKLAKKYACYENFFFLGRRFMFPTALEGALKLKEIAYVNANGYAAGELKHGPIALINEMCPTVAFCADKVTYSKILSNLMEVKARNGKIFAIAEEGSADLKGVVDDIFWIPQTCDEFAPILATVAGQLFSYYVAHQRGTEIDQPRNLAKSVTVE